ncbi:zf-DHHC-domain-containing protein [Infundibulicybe gibba]|nr:zf-DHHC-domain-containing protein [Infundibulicybe gibba]
MHPLLGRLIVNFVLGLICFIAYSSQIFIIWPWYGSVVSVELLGLLVPFNVLVGMLLWNYFLCVVTDPGQVPSNWEPDVDSDGYEVKKLTGRPRHCRVCNKFKPPRAHHCRQCDRCVLRMDHHCPWINNCVGHFNHGHFIRFLFYVDLACSYHVAMITWRVYSTMGSRYWDEPSGMELVFIILNYVACVPVLLCVGIFSLYHFKGLLQNTTTIEGWEKDKAATMVQRGKIRDVKFPYHLGKRRNIDAVLGSNPLLWCWPTVPPGTGLKYQLSSDDEGSMAVWPPRDPRETSEFQLPASPWTYENGSLNPNLEPNNARLRSSVKPKRSSQNASGTSALPPYHPDYAEAEDGEVVYTSESSSQDSLGAGSFVRRGSEGYEVRPVGREDMLSRYLRELGEEPQRYHRYIPQPLSDSEDDDVPLSQAVKHS